MKQHYHMLLIIITLFITSCYRPSNSNLFDEKFEWDGKTVWLEHKHDSLHVIHLYENEDELSQMVLPWKIYRFDYGDLDGDSIPEIAVGVIKKTVYDPILEKRLFLYQIAGGHAIIRLWMGSRVIHRVQDFYIDRDKTPALVHTFEKDKNGIMHEGEYKLGKFGLRLKQFLR
ncbi:MAG: nuclear receptor-binding factor 2 [Bacteroidales bacterium]|nr:nuclear receptor-binding factor 2 [Bacteroidales bacterium]